MNQTAKIIKINEDTISVIYDRDLSDKQKSSRRLWGVRDRSFRVTNTKGLPINEEDYVELFIPPGKTVAASFMVFIFPLLCFGLFFILAGVIFPGWSDMLKTAAGGAGFVFGFFLYALFRVVIKKLQKETLPEISRVISKAEACHPDQTGNKDCGSCGLCEK